LEEINHPDDLRTCLAHVERMRAREIDSFGMDKRYRRKDGSMVWTRLTNGCVRKSDGSIDYFVCMFEDISGRKQAEEEVRKSEERFSSSVLHSPLPILLFDDREEILALSQSWLEQTGYSKEELRRIEDWTARKGDLARETFNAPLEPHLIIMPSRIMVFITSVPKPLRAGGLTGGPPVSIQRSMSCPSAARDHSTRT
jgi:PAS domain-containing protein